MFVLFIHSILSGYDSILDIQSIDNLVLVSVFIIIIYLLFIIYYLLLCADFRIGDGLFGQWYWYDQFMVWISS